MPQTEIQLELFKALLTLVVTAATLALGWVVGQRLSAYWAIRQKRRELDLQASNEFYRLYGEFFAVWKLWSYCRPQKRPNMAPDLATPDFSRWELLQRAAAAEGALESLFVKLSSERNLTDRDIEVLSRFRQAYQSLREAIRDGRGLSWHGHDDPNYLSFKRLAHLVASLILNDASSAPTQDGRRADGLEQITAGTWTDHWQLQDADWREFKKPGRRKKRSAEPVAPEMSDATD